MGVVLSYGYNEMRSFQWNMSVLKGCVGMKGCVGTWAVGNTVQTIGHRGKISTLITL